MVDNLKFVLQIHGFYYIIIFLEFQIISKMVQGYTGKTDELYSNRLIDS